MRHIPTLVFLHKFCCLITICIILFVGQLTAQTQNNTNQNFQKQRVESMPKEVTKADLIQFNKTGDPKIDQGNYEKAKAEWISKNTNITKGNSPPKQNKVEENTINSSKPHFVLKLTTNNKHLESEFMKAINSFIRLESFRLIEKRRVVPLANNMGTVELFSAKEMLELYGRRIRPQNIKEGEEILNVEFVFSEEGIIKERLKK